MGRRNRCDAAFGFHLDDPPTLGTALRVWLVQIDMGKLVNRGLEPLRLGQASPHHHVPFPPVGDAVGLSEPLDIGDLLMWLWHMERIPEDEDFEFNR